MTSQELHLCKFLVCLAVLICSALSAGLQDAWLAYERFDYRSLKHTERLVRYSGDSASLDYLKLNYIANGPTYVVGAYGMVHTESFNAQVFSGSREPGYFFNYYTHFASLPDLVRIISHAARSGSLPKAAAIVQVPNPRLNGGEYLVKSSPQLVHPALFSYGAETGEPIARYLGRLTVAAIGQLKSRLQFRRVATAFHSPGSGYVVIDPRHCSASIKSASSDFPKWTRSVSGGLRHYLEMALAQPGETYAERVCGNGMSVGQTWDGSQAGAEHLRLSSPRSFPRTGHLKSRHAPELIRMIRRIDEVVSSGGSQAIFWVAPIAGGGDTVELNLILDSVIAQLPSVKIIDARYLISGMEFFTGDDKHPNERFFRWLISEIKKRGWL